jgi:outer membrane protein OmpA-like peptidoglycan-associated protein
MRKIIYLILIATFSNAGYGNLHAQGILNRAKQKAQDKINKKIDSKEDSAMDKVLDPSQPASGKKDNGAAATTDANTASGTKAIATYKNYDFVPGDKIIFQSQLADESVGEIPSQFTLVKGQADIQEEDGENVIHIPKGPFTILTPRFSNKSNIPDVFTIEFDFKDEEYGVNHVNVDFGYNVGTYGPADVMQGIGFNGNAANWTLGDVKYPDDLVAQVKTPMQWHHYAIAVNKNAGKAYIDQFRVANVNDLSGRHEPIGIEIVAYDNAYIKNIRIAAGGIDLYKKVTTDSRIITHGILFDVDQATIQPQSMGTINSIYNMLKKDAALKFEIDGHTDNTGNAAHNLVLSQSRAEVIKAQLVSMGIDAGRLTAKGFGDAKPLGTNDTPEGKANNRRVEFVKQ